MAKEGDWSVKGLSYTAGILCGADCVVMGVLTAAGIEFAWWNQTTLPIYQSIFWGGFDATLTGTISAAVQGAIGGALIGALVAWLYNNLK